MITYVPYVYKFFIEIIFKDTNNIFNNLFLLTLNDFLLAKRVIKQPAVEAREKKFENKAGVKFFFYNIL